MMPAKDTNRPIIAILADFPLWTVIDTIPDKTVKRANWLLSLYYSGQLPSDWQFHWLTLTKDVDNYAFQQHGNHTFHAIPESSKLLGLATGHIVNRKRISNILNKIQPDLVHAWGTEHAYALAGADFKGTKLLSMQGILTACCQRSEMPLFFKIQQFWERVALKKYSTISTESPWGEDRLKELVPSAHTEQIEYGISKDIFLIEKQLSSSPSCLYAGVPSSSKGSDTLIDCFSLPELSHIELRIAGDCTSDFARKLQARATDNIKFLGQLSPKEIADELSRTWCLVHPTLVDTSPNIVKEARCCGTPVVTTPEGGQTQYVVDGRSGFICSPGNVMEFVQAIQSVTQSSENSLSMGAFDQEECRNKVKPELTAGKFVSLYQKMLGKHE